MCMHGTEASLVLSDQLQLVVLYAHKCGKCVGEYTKCTGKVQRVY